jgi:hypothetical protein
MFTSCFVFKHFDLLQMRVSDLFGFRLLSFPRPNILRNFVINISGRLESNLFFVFCLFLFFGACEVQYVSMLACMSSEWYAVVLFSLSYIRTM